MACVTFFQLDRIVLSTLSESLLDFRMLSSDTRGPVLNFEFSENILCLGIVNPSPAETLGEIPSIGKAE